MYKFLILIFLFTGCVSARSSMNDFDLSFQRGDYAQAYQQSVKSKGNRDNAKSLLWNLNAGAAARLESDYKSSNEYFDHAEDSIASLQTTSGVGNSLNYVKGALVNDTALPYGGEEYDKVMVNTYKALNFLIQGNINDARVEFNRALSRQNDAKTLFAAEINALDEKLKKDSQDIKQKSSSSNSTGQLRSGFSVASVLADGDLQKRINGVYSNLDSFAVYKDFLNPFTCYVSGLFFLIQDDFSKGADLLKEAYSMSGKNRYIADDLDFAISKKKPKNQLWVIVENGLSPVKEEIRVDVPLFIFSSSIDYAGIALPRLVRRDADAKNIVLSSGNSSVLAYEFASMENVIFSEFKKDMKIIVAREISRAIFKTIAQYQAKEKLGEWGVLASIYQSITTAADLRIWTSLPKNFYLAKMQMPETRKVNLSLDGLSIDIEVPNCDNAVLLVRYISETNRIVYDFIKF